jgi:hypothetical protein
MKTETNHPWMQNVKPSPTPEQAALIEDLRRVAAAAHAALQTYANANRGGYESAAWRETYELINNVARTALIKWSDASSQYTM